MGIGSLFKWLKGKDKNGKTISAGYVLEHEPRSAEDVATLFHAFHLDRYFESIQPLLRPKITLTLTPADESGIGMAASRIGGRPDLKKGSEWPVNELGEPLSFIAQLNMEDLSRCDRSGIFPQRGLLSFFYCADQEAWGYDPKDKSRFRVIYSETADDLSRADYPTDLGANAIFQPNYVSFAEGISIPNWEHESIDGLIRDEDWDHYFELSEGDENQILGYAGCVQGAMELECQLVTNGLYCGDRTGYENPRRKELEAGKDDWLLLLQLGSDEEKTGMMWGDTGRLYFWIRKQDLANKEFDRAWCILQCH